MLDCPPDNAIMAKARRFAADDLDRDLYCVAEFLAELGHYGPDGKPYPVRTIIDLLGEDLRRRRDDRLGQRSRRLIGAGLGRVRAGCLQCRRFASGACRLETMPTYQPSATIGWPNGASWGDRLARCSYSATIRRRCSVGVLHQNANCLCVLEVL